MGVALPDVAMVGVGEGDAAAPGDPDEPSGAAQVGYLEAAVAAALRGEHRRARHRADLEDLGAARRVRSSPATPRCSRTASARATS